MNSPSYILSKADLIVEFAPRTIHLSYQLFVNFFKGDLSDDKILSGAYMVYGWMPTMLRLKGPKEPVLELAYVARFGAVDLVLLESCARTLNNSLVGTTKLLHFIAPDIYPIWDSRVYRALYGKSPHPYRVENPMSYFEYLDWCKDFEAICGFAQLKGRFESEAGYYVSNKRVTEAVLYALGPKPKKIKAI